MADGRDDSEKTEEPTPKRLREAQERGQVATSRELSHWFVLLGAAIALILALPSALEETARALGPLIWSPHLIDTAPNGLGAMLSDLVGSVAGALSLPVALLAAAAFLGNFLQHEPVLATEALEPKFERVSPAAGFKRLFSGRSVLEMVKGVVKIAAIGVAVAVAVEPIFASLDSLAGYEVVGLLGHIQDGAFRLLVAALAVMSVVAGLDVLYQRLALRKQLRMTREELKEEYKQTEGDPVVKGRIRQIRTERAKKRMMANVPKADVVITNPTHFAVALSYKPPAMAAPKVVAKGVDFLANRIRDVAREHGIPVVENPPLARALHQAVDVDEEIPAEHYVAVAQIVGYVMRLREKVAGRR